MIDVTFVAEGVDELSRKVLTVKNLIKKIKRNVEGIRKRRLKMIQVQAVEAVVGGKLNANILSSLSRY